MNSRGDGANHVEDLEQHGLGDGVVELSDVERSAGAGGSLTRGRGGLGLSSGGGSSSSSGLRGSGSRGLSLGRGRRSGFRHCFDDCLFYKRGWARCCTGCCMGSSTYKMVEGVYVGFRAGQISYS